MQLLLCKAIGYPGARKMKSCGTQNASNRSLSRTFVACIIGSAREIQVKSLMELLIKILVHLRLLCLALDCRNLLKPKLA